MKWGWLFDGRQLPLWLNCTAGVAMAYFMVDKFMIGNLGGVAFYALFVWANASIAAEKVCK